MERKDASFISGEKLAMYLSSLGYPQANELQGDSLDWIFEHKSIVPFLEWLCDSVNGSNLLSQEENEQYEALVSSGTAVLEGKELEQSLAIACHSDENTSPSALRDEIEALVQLSLHRNQRLQHLIMQKNRLSVHHARLTEKMTQEIQIEGEASLKYKRCLQQTQTDNKQLNSIRKEVAEGLSKLTAIHCMQDDSERTPFLCKQKFDDLIATEEKFTSELTAYTRKQFFEGIAEITGQEGTRFELLEISDPKTLLIRGESENVTINDCRELARLQSVFVCREGKKIDHNAMSAGIAAALDHAKLKAQSTMRQDAVTLNEKLGKLQRSLTEKRKEIIELTDKVLPNLLHEVAELQSARILQGDYNLKIARQDYFTSKQDEVINQLMIQRSRHELMGMSLEVESLRHRETHGLFTAVQSMLQTNTTLLEEGKNSLDQITQEPGNPNRSTIDTRDCFTARVHRLLTRSSNVSTNEDGKERTNLFLTYCSMLESTDQILLQLNSLRAQVKNTDGQQGDTLKLLEEKLRLCERVVYGSSTTEGGLPQLSPPGLADSLVQLEQLLHTLEQLVRDVIKDIESRKKILRSDGLKAMERNLFVCFFSDAPRLKRAIADLSAQVDTQLVTAK